MAWWRRSQADPDKRGFRRLGLIAFGVVGASVIVARLTQNTAAAGAVRGLAITLFALAAIALLGVVILMGEEVVDEMDASDPLRARHGGAYGPRIKRFIGQARRESRAWIASVPSRVRGLRRDLTRESLSRVAAASVEALRGVPPADAGPPPGAGRLARPTAEPPRARRRARTESELTDQPMTDQPMTDQPPTTTRRRPVNPRSAATASPARRTPAASTRARGIYTGTQSRD